MRLLHLALPLIVAAGAFPGAVDAQAAPASAAPRASTPEPRTHDPLPVLQKEPAAGRLRSGEKVLVDDGTCPAGKIKELTGGSNRNCGRQSDVRNPDECRLRVTGDQRASRCVDRK